VRINDLEFLQGAAFLRLIKGKSYISIDYLPSIHPSLYIVKSSSTESAILFKISTKPTSSWSFHFTLQEENALTQFHQTYSGVKLFIALICHRDGICCLSEEQLWTIINPTEGLTQQYVSVKRELRGSYYVRGTGRVPLKHTVPQSNWPDIILSE
jgi:hypothetical protein